VQRRLGLTGEQSVRLRETTRRFAAQRQQIMQRERETRRALRLATAPGDSSADQKVIGRQLDSLVALQQRRVALLAEEQREMATFLTPYQRAQFLAMQERALRAAQQLRQQRAAAARESLP
jgi:Spy/CpxP family protein refolding chaperone